MYLKTTVNKKNEIVKGSEPLNSKKAPFLSDFSDKESKWDYHRANAQSVGQLYDRADNPRLEKLGDRIRTCSGLLEYKPSIDSTGESSLTLHRAFSCRVRHCPVCQWRKSVKNVAKFHERLPELVAAYPKAEWLLLTLTVKNPEMSDLRETLKHMNASWQRLIQRDIWPAKGFIRTTEVTKGKDGKPHPHFHCLIMVDSGYFSGKNYLSAKAWSSLWKEALRADYTPVINVKKVKAISEKAKQAEANGDKKAGLYAAVAETLKYAVKAEDLVDDGLFLFGITEQLRGLRFVATGGVLKGLLKDVKNPKPDDDDKEDGDDKEEEEEKPSLFFGWQHLEKRYRQVKIPVIQRVYDVCPFDEDEQISVDNVNEGDLSLLGVYADSPRAKPVERTEWADGDEGATFAVIRECSTLTP